MAHTFRKSKQLAKKHTCLKDLAGNYSQCHTFGETSSNYDYTIFILVVKNIHVKLEYSSRLM